jgi:hypothetical protein
MKLRLHTPLSGPGRAAAVLSAALTALATTGPAQAEVVTINTPIALPSTSGGLYINLVTGASGASPLSGWDINPYRNGTQLAFFWAGSSAGVASGTGYADLPVGSVVSSASTFSTNAGAAFAAAFQTPGVHTLGVRFQNEATSAVNYGYLTLSTTGPTGYPATLLGWSYDNSGAAITVVPEVSTTVMLWLGLLGLAAANARKRREPADR